MLIAKNNFFESLPVQFRLTGSGKSNSYSMFYSESDSENFEFLVPIPTFDCDGVGFRTPMQDSTSNVHIFLNLPTRLMS